MPQHHYEVTIVTPITKEVTVVSAPVTPMTIVNPASDVVEIKVHTEA